MDIEKLFKEFVEKEWHDGHEPQGEHDHYEEENLDEAFWKVIVPDMPPVFVEAGSAAEIKASMRKKLKGEAFKELVIDRVSKAEMVKKYRELAKGKGDSDDEEEVDESLLSEKKATISKFKDPKVKDLTIKLAKERGLKVKELGGDKIEISGSERYVSQTISPLVNKAKIEEQPNLKETMKLEDTVKNVLSKKPKVEEQKTKVDEILPALAVGAALSSSKKHKVKNTKNEDTDQDPPGTQGDKAKYLKARAKVLKKFGVSSCSQLDGDEKKACYSALDAAHVSDDEEGEKKEDVQKFSKLFSHLKGMMKEKKKKMLKGYSQNY